MSAAVFLHFSIKGFASSNKREMSGSAPWVSALVKIQYQYEFGSKVGSSFLECRVK